MAITALGSATLNYQLTNYAQGLFNDLVDVTKLAERLAPTTPVPGAAGQFKKFDDKNSFMPEKTERALGGDPVVIKFNASDDSYSCRPQALEVRVDKEEEQAAGSQGEEVAMALLDQGKIKSLVNKQLLSHVKDVADYVLANTTATTSYGADSGAWSNPDINPLDQINAELLALAQDVGSTQNINVTMDLGVWDIIRRNPKVKAQALFGASSSLAYIGLEQFKSALILPVDVMAANVVYDTTRLDQTSKKTRVMAGTFLIHYSIPGATIYDPSAFKTFTVGAGGLVAGVRTYVAQNQLWRGHLVDWSRDIKKTSALSIRRFNVS